MQLQEGEVKELIELRLGKVDHTYLFRYEKGYEVELIKELLLQAYSSLNIDFFDAAVMAYKIVRARSNYEVIPTQLSKDIAKAAVDAMFCAVETEKYEHEKLQKELFSNRIGKRGYFSFELEQRRKRIDILVNDLIPSVKEYVNRVENY